MRRLGRVAHALELLPRITVQRRGRLPPPSLRASLDAEVHLRNRRRSRSTEAPEHLRRFSSEVRLLGPADVQVAAVEGRVGAARARCSVQERLGLHDNPLCGLDRLSLAVPAEAGSVRVEREIVRDVLRIRRPERRDAFSPTVMSRSAAEYLPRRLRARARASVDPGLGDPDRPSITQRLLHCRECPVVIAGGVSHSPSPRQAASISCGWSVFGCRLRSRARS